MPWLETTHNSAPNFVADDESISRNSGRQVDWEEVSSDFIPNGGQYKVIPAGWPMTQQGDGTIVPATEDDVTPGNASMLLFTTAHEGNRKDSLSGYGALVGGVIYADLLPVDIDDYDEGLAANGCFFVWETYEDSREPSA